MLGLTYGELFIVCFVTAVIVSAPYWPKLGEALARLRAGPRNRPAAAGVPRPSDPADDG